MLDRERLNMDELSRILVVCWIEIIVIAFCDLKDLGCWYNELSSVSIRLLSTNSSLKMMFLKMRKMNSNVAPRNRSGSFKAKG